MPLMSGKKQVAGITSGHQVVVAGPIDICKTPAPPAPAPVPMPYPNVSMTLTPGGGYATKTMTLCAPMFTRNSKTALSNGDQPGVAMGIISNKIMGAAAATSGSSDVDGEGGGVVRTLDQGESNCGSPSNAKIASFAAGAGDAERKDVQEVLCEAFLAEADRHCKIIKQNYDNHPGGPRAPRGQFLEGMVGRLPPGIAQHLQVDQLAGFVSRIGGNVMTLAAMRASANPAIQALGIGATAAVGVVNALGLAPSVARGSLLGRLGGLVGSTVGRTPLGRWRMRPLFPDLRTGGGIVAEVKGPYDTPGRNHRHYNKLDPNNKLMDIDGKTCDPEGKVLTADNSCVGGPTRAEAQATIMPWLR